MIRLVLSYQDLKSLLVNVCYLTLVNVKAKFFLEEQLNVTLKFSNLVG